MLAQHPIFYRTPTSAGMRLDILDLKEHHVEDRLVKLVKKMGGISYKFTSPARRSVPDRLILLNGHIFFVECKAPGKTATDSQAEEHRKIREQGGQVWIASNYDEVALILDVYSTGRELWTSVKSSI